VNGRKSLQRYWQAPAFAIAKDEYRYKPNGQDGQVLKQTRE